MRILAIRIRHVHFQELLSHSSVYGGHSLTPKETACPVRVQRDPERTPALGVLPYRSIQIGVGASMVQRFVDEWVESIEDVTEMARQLKQQLDQKKGVSVEELTSLWLIPTERGYDIPELLSKTLKVDATSWQAS